MITSAVNRVLMYLRHINTEKQKINHKSIQLHPLHEPKTTGITPDTKVATDEELQISLTALHQLHPKYRGIINDLILQEIPSRQYAQEKGLVHTRVPCELRYALQKLRKVPEIKKLGTQCKKSN